MNMNTFDILNIVLVMYILIFVFKNNETLSNFTLIKKSVKVKTENQTTTSTNNNNSNQELEQELYKRKLLYRDRSILEDKLIAPEQRHESHVHVEFDKPSPIYTRGEPENYQLVGLLSREDIDKKYQLFGRRTYPGSPEWEYYIGGRDSGGLDYKFPIDNKQEIYDGTTMVNPVDNDTYNVKIYEFNKPRYIPFIK
jgi:hypothetical protein